MPYTLDEKNKLVLYNWRPVVFLHGWNDRQLAELQMSMARVRAVMQLLRGTIHG